MTTALILTTVGLSRCHA